ncbi:uncharacterized protein LOC144652310 [Oculina patagonica]
MKAKRKWRPRKVHLKDPKPKGQAIDNDIHKEIAKVEKRKVFDVQEDDGADYTGLDSGPEEDEVQGNTSTSAKATVDMRKDEEQGEPGPSSLPPPSLMYNDTNLLSLPSGGDVEKYDLKVMSNLFTTEKMANGIVEKGSKASTEPELDSNRVNLLKRFIKEKFGEGALNKKWHAIRLSLNQKCLDSKRKIVPKKGDNEDDESED